jgi:trimeric autotransporter adhesin
VQPVALISALGQQDWAGKALAQHASSPPLNMQVYSVGTSTITSNSSSTAATAAETSKAAASAARTPIYSAMLDGQGELVAAVADMSAFDLLLTPQAVTEGELIPVSPSSEQESTMKATFKSLLSKRPRFVVVDGNVPAATVKAIAATLHTDDGKSTSNSSSTALVYEPISIAKGVRVVEADVLSSVTIIKPNRYEVHALAKAIRERMGLEALNDDEDDEEDDEEGDEGEENPQPPSSATAASTKSGSGLKSNQLKAAPSRATIKHSFVSDPTGGGLKSTGTTTTVKEPSGKVTTKKTGTDSSTASASAAASAMGGNWANLASSLIEAQQKQQRQGQKNQQEQEDQEVENGEDGGEEGGAEDSALDYGLLTAAQTVLAAMIRPVPLGSSASSPGPVLQGASSGGALGALHAFSAATGTPVGSAAPPATPSPAVAGRLVEGRKHVLVTLGAEGVLWLSAPPASSTHASDLMMTLPFFMAAGHPSLGMDFKLIPAPKVEQHNIAKVTGAGDTFIGSVLASLVQGLSMAQSLRHGLAAAKIAIEKPSSSATMTAPNPSTINASLCWPVVSQVAEAFVTKVDEGYD